MLHSRRGAADLNDVHPSTDTVAAVTGSPGGPFFGAPTSAELDELENHQGHDIDVILARATRAAEAAERIGDTVLGHRARLVQADMLQREGDAGQAARTFLAIHRWAKEHDVRPLLARSHFHLALTYHYLGDHSASLEHALSSVEMLEDAAPAGLRIIYLVRLANSLAESGSVEAARERYRQAERLAVDIGDPTRQLMILNNLAYTELEAGEADEAAAIMHRMYAVARVLGRPFLVVERDTIANIQISLGRFAEAEETLQAVYDAPRWFEVHDFADAALTLALAQRRLGALDRAQASLDKCRALCDDQALAGVRVRAMAEQAELYAARDDHREAFEEYKRFHAASEELRSMQQEARARTRQAMFETAEARRDAERYREQARRDPLTGLYNRRHVDERLPQAIAHALQSGEPLTVALVDLDHFKNINDTLSHDVGDRVLVAVADLLASHLDQTLGDGLAARLGGEEFLVVLPGVGADAASRLDALRRAVAAYPWADVTGALPVTVSIGAATTGAADGDTQGALLAEADRRMYVAKRAGRNRVVVA
ncbi:tetratricopeptide repeat-containing diguanylate cyclase [Jidongwangia harbinensis]|uniref:tetratricopeptide repeat-containing diguanylate cyclase n=1 Tax=Jidongwangia harbinensis TaxID=2878561 RepID=UPI001CDA0CE3|nr:GGDEF domain-containing protein [Jidongwangia harbinensis]MCA2216603.1 GGDEF domain-containing protein [Jidongwangia harbinensis]